MLTCYLDESGSDAENPVLTIAGYVGREAAWVDFEKEAEQWFTEFAVAVCHAKDLHSGRREFKDWTVLRKLAFVSRLCLARNKHAMMGFSMSAAKSAYTLRADESDRVRTVTPYTFCFNVTFDRILRDISAGLGKAAYEEGLILKLEDGHKNREEAREQFEDIRTRHGLEKILVDLQFVPKTSSRAIQLADLLAFFSRRNAIASIKARAEGAAQFPFETIDKVIVEGLPHWAFVATDFDNPHDGAPFINLPKFG